MWFNEKNAIKKLARNLDTDMKKMNVITIETVKRYGFISKKFPPKKPLSSFGGMHKPRGQFLGLF